MHFYPPSTKNAATQIDLRKSHLQPWRVLVLIWKQNNAETPCWQLNNRANSSIWRLDVCLSWYEFLQNIARLMNGYGVSSIDELIKTVDEGGTDPKKKRWHHFSAMSRRWKCGGFFAVKSVCYLFVFVCYCAQKRGKRKQWRKRCWKQKIFRRRRTVVAVVCYCLLLRPKKAVFDRLRQSKKRGDRVGRLTPWKTKKTRKSVCYCVCYNI